MIWKDKVKRREYMKEYQQKVRRLELEFKQLKKSQMIEEREKRKKIKKRLYRRYRYLNERGLENRRRKNLNLPLVCEGFKKEIELLFCVSNIFKSETIVYHDRLILNGLELDVYIPSLKLAFEYQGVQHYKIDGFFIKTIDQFEAQQFRDKRKKELCQQKGIILIEIRYDEKLSEQLILEKLKNYDFELKQKRL